MLTFFRSFMSSKVGVVIALAFLGLIALAFAAGDITGSRQMSTAASGDTVAKVGGRKLGSTDLGQAASVALERQKQENPRLSMAALIAGGGLSQALDQLIDRTAMAVFGEQHGIVASDRLIDSEIAKIPAFKGLDGKFSDAAYKALLSQRGLSDASVRNDLASGLIARQLLVPAAFGARLPAEVVSRYAALLTESRTGAIALLPAAVFKPQGEPSAQALAAYYAANQTRFIRPERRIIRYATFDESALRSVPAPTEAEIAARYAATRARYAASETRKITQLVLPTEAAARAVLAEVTGGKSLETAASTKGLATAPLGPVDRAAMTSQTNDAIAAAAFAGARGSMAGPLRGPLGWTLLRIDAAEAKPARSLDQARAEISAALSAEKKRAALSDFTAKVEDEFDKGGSLGDVIKELGLQLKTTPALTADGRIYGGTAKDTAPPELARVLSVAFAMEREGQPQLAEIVPGKQFLVFDVSQITPSATAPLAEIRPSVLADYQLQQGAAAAKAAAEKIQAAVRKGTDLGAATAALGVAGVPPVDRLTMTRAQLTQAGQNVPPPLGLLFSMARGTVKILAAPMNRGWYIVSLNTITPGNAAAIAPVLGQAQQELSAVAGREYADQLRTAMRSEVGVTRNQAAIDAVAKRLTGGN